MLAAVLVVALVLPAAAGEITVGKRAVPPYAHVGDVITYQMWVENPNTTFDLRVDWTWDILAPGTPAEDVTEPVVPPALPYVLTPLGTPGARQEYGFTAVITEDMLVPHPTEPPGTFAVINTFGARGQNLYDPFPENCEGEVDAVVTIVNPCIRVHKDVDCDKSKEGDEVTYTICVVNCGDTELLNLMVTDTIIDLTGLFPTTLAVGESLCVDVPYTIPGGAADPLINEVTATAEDLLAFVVSDTDFAQVDLVHPDFEVFADCALTAPVPPGGNAEFEVTINNTGDCDLVVTTNPAITPAPGTILAGGSATGTATVPDPGGVDEICLDLMAYWTLPPDQYPCVMTNTDSLPAQACCPVGEPCIRVHKDVDCDKSKEGDDVTYTICVVNCGEISLYGLDVVDSILDMSGYVWPANFLPGDSLCVDVPYTIPAGSPDPLINTVTATANTAEDLSGQTLSDTDSAEVDLVHPAFDVYADCALTAPVPPGGNAEFDVTIDNTGDCDLVVTTNPAITPPPGTIPAGGSATGTVTVPDPGGVDEICLDLMAYWTLPPDQYPCEMTNTDSMPTGACCPVGEPCIRVHKDVDCDKSKEGDDVTYTICVVNCGEIPLYGLDVVDSILDMSGYVWPADFLPGDSLCVDVPYTIPAGSPDPLINTVTATANTAEDLSGDTLTDTDTAEVDLVHPDFDVSVDCLTDPVEPGGDADFEITIDNTGDCDLVVTTNPAITPAPGTIPAGGSATGTVTVPDPGGVSEICLDIMAYWTLPPDQYPCEMTNTDSMPGRACCPIEGENGCTPGFWKNHPDCWCETYEPGDRVDSVFTIPSELGNLADDTLMQAFGYGGGKGIYGGARILLRAAVAAILNACNDNVAYPMGETAVINAVNAALATLDRQEMVGLGGILDMYNNYGCSIDAHCDPITDGPEEAWGPALRGEEPEGLDGLISGEKQDVDQLPTEVAVSQSSPNPFRDTARIQFQLPTSGAVTIDVYDVAGRHVTSLMDEEKPAGYHEAVWNGRNSAGTPVPAGVYFYRVLLDDETLLRKMILVR
jgi:uncharacterized repeat protein (TIGR01451 family)